MGKYDVTEGKIQEEIEAYGAEKDAIDMEIEASEPAIKIKWVAGWNIPGYLPESDPALFDEWQDAHGYIYDAVQRFWDEDAQASDPDAPGDSEQADAKWLDVDTALNLAHYGGSWGSYNGDQSLWFWIVQAEDTTHNIAGDE